MEKRKTIFDYMGQIFMIYGITITILNIFCLIFGEDAREYSTMFSMGKEGLSVATSGQFLLIAACIVSLRFLFFTDTLIKKMSIAGRTIGMIGMILVIMSGFIILFDWFPANQWKPWVMFLLCFFISFGISMTVMMLKERMENKKMEQALARIKQEEKGKEQ